MSVQVIVETIVPAVSWRLMSKPRQRDIHLHYIVFINRVTATTIQMEDEEVARVSVQKAFWHRRGVVNQFAEQFTRSIVGPGPTIH